MSLTIRPMLARDPNEHERPATQLELFFDLVFVIAIAAATESLHHAISANHGYAIFPAFLFIFVAIWWSWLNWTWFASAFDNGDVVFRVLTIVQMGGALLFAAGISHIIETLNFGYGLIGWVVMRLALVTLWLRAAKDNPEFKTTCTRYAIGVAAAQALWVLIYFVTPPASTAFLVMGCLVFLFEFMVPVIAERAKMTPFHRHHIIERYGLLNIIVLGEALLAMALGAGSFYEGHFELAMVINFIAALVVVFVLWWLYFGEREHLKSPSMINTFTWGYGHFFIFLAGAMLGAGIGATNDVIANHSEITGAQANWFASIPIVLYLVALFVVRDAFHDLGHRKFALLTGASVVLILGYLGFGLISFAVVLIVTLIWREMPRHAHSPTDPV